MCVLLCAIWEVLLKCANANLNSFICLFALPNLWLPKQNAKDAKEILKFREWPFLPTIALRPQTPQNPQLKRGVQIVGI